MYNVLQPKYKTEIIPVPQTSKNIAKQIQRAIKFKLSSKALVLKIQNEFNSCQPFPGCIWTSKPCSFCGKIPGSRDGKAKGGNMNAPK